MASFIGEYKAKVDDRGRLVFPSAFKELCADCEKLVRRADGEGK